MLNDEGPPDGPKKSASGPSDRDSSETSSNSLPSLSLPRGGGAIRGIDEKFSANPVTGTGSFTIPIFTTPGRAGFYPKLALSYDSVAGNGPFGIGWTLSIPAVTRKTDKGLPRYQDATHSDIFILSEAEDLVPSLILQGSTWMPEIVQGAEGDITYSIQRYHPRIEGAFARIEQWRNQQTGETHWRSTTKDNITSIYGIDATSRIVDPTDASRVFKWLLEESYDDKGNAITYEYKQENRDAIDPTLPQEKNRLASPTGFAQLYPKRIKYGNKMPFAGILGYCRRSSLQDPP
jgi:Salmonella virulence plasmid 65kDa B protein